MRSPVTVRVVSLLSTKTTLLANSGLYALREESAADRIDFRHNVQQRFVAQFAEHPLPEAGDRNLPRPARSIGDFQTAELDGCIGSDVDRKFGDDSILGILEDGVAETVANDVWIAPRAGNGDGDQKRPVSSSRM